MTVSSVAISPQKQKEIAERYCVLMEEAKARFNVINHTAQNEANFPLAMVREICYLQFRLLCEMIALGCLGAHGEFLDTNSLKRTWKPGEIIKGLERLNPDFYPQPMEHTLVGGVHQLTGRSDLNFLDRKHLIDLWIKAGDIVHRGSISRMYDPRKHPKGDNSDIFEWGDKLSTLLNSHWIPLVDSKMGMFVTLTSLNGPKAAASIFDFQANKMVQVLTVTAP